MSKKSFVNRSVEDRAIDNPNNAAEEILALLGDSPYRGTCHNCVYYRGQPGLRCLRQKECFPETAVLWRGRKEELTYDFRDPKFVLAKS